MTTRTLGLAGIALALLALPGRVHAAPPTPTPQPGWDQVASTPPPPATTPIGPPVVASAPPAPDEVMRRRGNRLLIAGATLAGVGLVLNALRAHVASGPCQREPDSFDTCEMPWHLATPAAWITNIASLPMLAIGAKYRGRYDVLVDPEGHRIRRPVMIAVGSTLLGLGVVASFGLRMAWFTDYVSPGGSQAFDFADPGQAFAYYGGLQLSSMAIGGGIAMLVHGSARPPRAAQTARRWRILPTATGLQIVGRF